MRLAQMTVQDHHHIVCSHSINYTQGTSLTINLTFKEQACFVDRVFLYSLDERQLDMFEVVSTVKPNKLLSAIV